MCDRYSVRHGYICEDCFEELVATGRQTDIKMFMDTEKQPRELEDSNAVFNLYDSIFPDHRDRHDTKQNRYYGG